MKQVELQIRLTLHSTSLFFPRVCKHTVLLLSGGLLETEKVKSAKGVIPISDSTKKRVHTSHRQRTACECETQADTVGDKGPQYSKGSPQI